MSLPVVREFGPERRAPGCSWSAGERAGYFLNSNVHAGLLRERTGAEEASFAGWEGANVLAIVLHQSAKHPQTDSVQEAQ